MHTTDICRVDLDDANGATSSGEYLTPDEEPPKSSTSGWTWTPSSSATNVKNDDDSSIQPQSTASSLSRHEGRSDDLLSASITDVHHIIARELFLDLFPVRSQIHRLLGVIHFIAILQSAVLGIVVAGVPYSQADDEDADYTTALFIVVSISAAIGFCMFHVYRVFGGLLVMHFLVMYKVSKHFIIIFLLSSFLSGTTAVLASIPLKPLPTRGFDEPALVYYLLLVLFAGLRMVIELLALPRSYYMYKTLHVYKPGDQLKSLESQSVHGSESPATTIVRHPPVRSLTVAPRPPHSTRRRKHRSTQRRIQHVIEDEPHIYQVHDATLALFFRVYNIANLVAKCASLANAAAAAIIVTSDVQSNETLVFPNNSVPFSRDYETGLVIVVFLVAAYTFVSSGFPLLSYRITSVQKRLYAERVLDGLKILFHAVCTGLCTYPVYKYYEGVSTRCVVSGSTCPPDTGTLLAHVPYYSIITCCSALMVVTHAVRCHSTIQLHKVVKRQTAQFLLSQNHRQTTATIGSMDSLPSRSHFTGLI